MKIFVISILSLITQGAVMILSLSFASAFLDDFALKEWNLGIASYAFVSLFDFGASTFILRDLASGEKIRVASAKDLSKTMIICGFVLSLFFLTLNFFVLTETTYLIIIGAMLGRVIINIIGVMNAAFGRIIVEKGSKIIFGLTMIFSQYLLLSYNFGVYSLAISIYISVIIQFTFLYYVNDIFRNIIKTSKFNLLSIWNNRVEHINWLLYTLPAFFIFNFQIFAIGFWSETDNVALYNTIHQLLYTVIAISGVVSYVSGPAISRLNFISKQSRNTLIIHTAKVVSTSVAIGLSIVLMFLPIIQDVMFKNINLTVNFNLWVLFAFYIIIEVFQMSMVNALIYTGHTDFWKVNLSSAFLNTTLCWLLIPSYGLLGAVLSIIISQTLTCNFFNIRLSFKKLEIPWNKALFVLFISLLFFTINISLYYILYNNIIALIFSIIIIILLFIKYIMNSLRFIVDEYYLIKIDE